MILLLGGTSEAADIVKELARRKLPVLISTSTDTPVGMESDQTVSLRTGCLDEGEVVFLIREKSIRAVIDATHPYAEEITRNAQAAARHTGTPYLRLLRPEFQLPAGVHVADGHVSAAALAFGFGPPVLLTTGSKNLSPYVEEMRRTGIPLVVRVLPLPASLEACRGSGLPSDRVIAGRGPFSVNENLRVLRRYHIGVLVTKNSGKAGGVQEKIQAALSEKCEVVVVARPPCRCPKEVSCSSTDELVRMLRDLRILDE